jgi:hypothetical protein
MFKKKHTDENTSDFTLRVNETQKVLNFLTEKMGFILVETANDKHDKPKSWLKSIEVRNSFGNHYSLQPDLSTISGKGISNNAIVINTDDCLRDYYNLKKAEEIHSCSKPKYLPEGLAFEATDKWGNGYILLEKRNYIDN